MYTTVLFLMYFGFLRQKEKRYSQYGELKNENEVGTYRGNGVIFQADSKS